VVTTSGPVDHAQLQALLAAGNVTTVEQDRRVYSTQVVEEMSEVRQRKASSTSSSSSSSSSSDEEKDGTALKVVHVEGVKLVVAHREDMDK